MIKDKITYVTEPSLPDLDDFLPYLKEIWDSKILTNGGRFHQELEDALCNYLGVPYLSLFCNGTIALVTALQALSIKDEVITTPYSFVATTNSLLWNNLKPNFVDIDPNTLNIDPSKIEAAITSKTTAILAVHCYGQPCDLDAIQYIAKKHRLKLIYDAAHAFGVKYKNGSVLNYGDLSVLSFHATKIFNTFEGGAIISNNAEMKRKIDNLKNFGFADEITVVESGINGKMSEFNSALGILQLNNIDSYINQRKLIDIEYRNGLANVNGIRCINQNNYEPNFSYFPIIVDDGYKLTRDELYNKLKLKNIYARRYFYPLISQFPMYNMLPSANPNNLPVAT